MSDHSNDEFTKPVDSSAGPGAYGTEAYEQVFTGGGSHAAKLGGAKGVTGNPTGTLRGLGSGIGSPKESTAGAAFGQQQRAAQLHPTGRYKSSVLSNYRPRGALISHAENKQGIVGGIETVISAIAANAGIAEDNAVAFSALIDALVTDVYVNAYSDKRDWSHTIDVPGCQLDAIIIKNTIVELVGGHFRRYARAMAPIVVEVISSNKPAYHELIMARANAHGLTYEAAICSFDGADQLTGADRSVHARNATIKQLALNAAYKSGGDFNTVSSSAASATSSLDYRPPGSY